jgi:hypothetical protein
MLMDRISLSDGATMIHLYAAPGGSNEIQLLEQSISGPEWERLKNVAIRVLEWRGESDAAEKLRRYPFLLFKGTNGFADEFQVLYFRAPMDAYVELAEWAEEEAVQQDYQVMAEVITELCSYVRFVAVDIDTAEGPQPVSPPVLVVTSDVVERALGDAEELIARQGATSGLDRVHTAFHGYLKEVASDAGLETPANASITQMFRVIRQQHPRFRSEGPRQADIDRIMRSAATIVDALNPLRNMASVAHPSDTLLESPEAMLVINCVRSLLHYVYSRIHS